LPLLLFAVELLPLRPFVFSVFTPAVLALPLLVVTTAVLDETELAFARGFMLALVSTTPFLVALLLLAFVWSLLSQPARKLARMSATGRAKVRRIEFLLCIAQV
jgi:hypothetical protein